MSIERALLVALFANDDEHADRLLSALVFRRPHRSRAPVNRAGRPVIPDDLKRRALAIYTAHGIEAAMAHTGRGERTVRRWISDARLLGD